MVYNNYLDNAINTFLILDNWQPYQDEDTLAECLVNFIKMDLERIGVDISKLDFDFKILAFTPNYINFIPKNEYTKSLLSNKSLFQIIRFLKIEKMNL